MRELNRALIQLVCAGAGVCGYVCILDSSSGRVAINEDQAAELPGLAGRATRAGPVGPDCRLGPGL